jgi:hypothetical protein
MTTPWAPPPPPPPGYVPKPTPPANRLVRECPPPIGAAWLPWAIILLGLFT